MTKIYPTKSISELKRSLVIIFGVSESWRHEVSQMYNIFYDIFDFDVLPELFWASEAENGQKREIQRPEAPR